MSSRELNDLRVSELVGFLVQKHALQEKLSRPVE